MKKIEAIIRKTKFEDVKEALLAADIEWFSYYDVRGEGKMRQARIYRGVMYDTSSIERVLINIVVRDKNVEKTIAAILPVLDDFERAIADKSEDPKAIKEGVQMIFNKFTKTLEGLGVKKIETADKDFDVDYHEAIAMVPGMGDDKKGKVIDCVQTGYTLNDKVIRHAKVAVGQ